MKTYIILIKDRLVILKVINSAEKAEVYFYCLCKN